MGIEPPFFVMNFSKPCRAAWMSVPILLPFCYPDCTMKFKIGDKVQPIGDKIRLASVRPVMTVISLKEDQGLVTCTWPYKGTMKESNFAEDAVESFQVPSPPA